MLETWGEIVDDVTRRFSDVRPLHPALLHLRVDRPGGSVELRARPMVLPTGQPWLMLAASICDKSRLRGRAALVANRHLPVGGLATLGDRVVLRHHAPMADLTAEHLAVLIENLADVALVLQRGEPPYAYLFH